MNKWFKFSIIFIILIIVLIYFFNRSENSEVCFGNSCFNVEIANTNAERETGLMYRESLDQNSGMLFVFDNSGNYPFWMKNTLIDLDIIWIDSNLNVIDIRSAQPCKGDPCEIINHKGLAKYVVEINKGLASNYGINIGDKVNFVGINNI